MKQERYLDESGSKDWIDHCYERMSPLEFEAAMKFTIGKYHTRMGKKDPEAQELAKIDDYHNRWADALFSSGIYRDNREELKKYTILTVETFLNETTL